MNTPSVAEQAVTNSQLFKGDQWFSVVDMDQETGIGREMSQVALTHLLDAGKVSKKRVKKNSCGGIVWIYRRLAFRPIDYLTTSYRRHTNEELGLEPIFWWSII